MAGVESHHMIGVRDATAGGKPAHGALNVLPVIIYTDVYTLIAIDQNLGGGGEEESYTLPLLHNIGKEHWGKYSSNYLLHLFPKFYGASTLCTSVFLHSIQDLSWTCLCTCSLTIYSLRHTYSE